VRSDVTVVVVPRERYSATERALTTLYANTPEPFNLVYVSAGAPDCVQSYLEREASEKSFRLVTTPHYLAPNIARNLAMREVSTKYVVFLDNDALVTPGWLSRLVECAEETQAWIVGPLYLIGEIEEQTIHMSGGTLHLKQFGDRQVLYDEHRSADLPLGNVRDQLHRGTCDFVEFHCMLLRTDLFDRIGPLDEQLLSHHEHIDVGWAARQAGGAVYIEPASIVTYLPPPPFVASDLPYFMLRWNDDWAHSTIDHFKRKWGVDATRHFGDEYSNQQLEDTTVRFGRAHRRLATGLKISGNGHSESPLDQARLMVALFLSVDRDSFDLALTDADDLQVEIVRGLTPEATLEGLPDLLNRAEKEGLNVHIRPCSPRRPSVPSLVKVEVDESGLTGLEPYAFLTLKTAADRYQVWIAIDRSNRRSASLLRQLAAAYSQPGDTTGFTRIAGSPVVDRDSFDAPERTRRATLHNGMTGVITTGSELEGSPALSHLWASQTY
jgi:GT2 family glycosyltransferase